MLRNREGASVDPVPFYVAAACGFLFCLSFGPPYLVAVLGTTLGAGVAASLVVALGLAGGAWHRLVWTHHPDHRDRVPAAVRLKKVYIGTALLFGVMVLLMIPLM